MANTYVPFPYSGSQAIVSSERIHLHARKDSVLMFARKSIGLSSVATINLDCYEKVVVNSPKIYLGLYARESLILGDTFTRVLTNFLNSLSIAGTMLQSAGESKIEESMSKMAIAGVKIKESSNILKESLPGVLSSISYTE